MILVRGPNVVEAPHEPEGRARQSPARRSCIAKLRRARSDAPYRFKVPMHGRKAEAAIHEPSEEPLSFGLRQSSGAFGCGPEPRERQRTGALQDAAASSYAPLRFMVP